jgi:hypothetical protein
MIITSKFFSFNMWEWFLQSSVLEWTESDLSKINWLCGVILLNPIVLVPWGRFPLCHTPINPISAFWDQISILIVGCVTTWSRGLHQLVSEFGSETRSYPSVIFVFLVSLVSNFFFSLILQHIKKTKKYLFHLITFQNISVA